MNTLITLSLFSLNLVSSYSHTIYSILTVLLYKFMLRCYMFTIFFVIAGILLRLAPHIPNFTPITAAALFGGVYLKRGRAFLIPLLALALSDYLLLYINPYNTPMVNFIKIYPLSAMFHSTTLYVWGSFLISGLIGLWLRKHNKPTYIMVASLLASLQFFLITNFGVWASTNMYSHDLNGLIQSYIMGVPFYRYTLLGDFFYTTVLFVSYGLVLKAIKRRSGIILIEEHKKA